MTPDQQNFLRWISFDEEKPPQDGTPFLVFKVPASHVSPSTVEFMNKLNECKYEVMWMSKDGFYLPWSSDMMTTFSHWARLEPPR